MPDCIFEELGHTAEIGVRVQADSPEQLFACTARAMFSLLRVLPNENAQRVSLHVTIDSIDGESLMVDWLSELLYLYETTGAIFGEYTILRWQATHLDAQIVGYSPLSTPVVHVKAATYHQLYVQANADGWSAQVFFDI